MSETTYYQRNREVILNRAKDCYENNKELLRERAKYKYRELSEEEKNIKREYGQKRYHKISEDTKKRLKYYQKIIVRLENSLHNDKMHFRIAIATIFFVYSFINF